MKKDEKRKFRKEQKAQAKKLAAAKKQAENARLEKKNNTQSYPQIDPAFIKAVEDLCDKEKKDATSGNKKKKWGVRIISTALVLALGGGCTFALYKSNEPHNHGPEETDPISTSTMDPTSELTDEPIYETSTPSHSIEPSMEPSAEASVEPSATISRKPWVKPTSRPTVTGSPAVDTTLEPTDHVHNFLDWFSFDDEKEARQCSICGENEYRDHVYKHSYTIEKTSTAGSHYRVDNQECLTCGHKHEKKTEEKCTFGTLTYDKKYEYQECLYCHETLKTPHDLYTVTKGNYEITKCRHSGCRFEHKEYVGSIETSEDPVYPVYPPQESIVIPSTSEPPQESTVIPSTPEPSRNQDPDVSNNPGIGDGGIKDFPEESEQLPDIPPDIEINTPAPVSSSAPASSSAPESSSAPTDGRDPGKLDENGQTGIGTGGKKPFDDAEEETQTQAQAATQASLEHRLATLKNVRNKLKEYITYTSATDNKEKYMKFRPVK